LEYCIPLLKIGGRFFAAKGLDPENEIAAAQKALTVLNSQVEYFAKYKLGEGVDYRSLIIIKKIGHTPAKYPRQAGKPKKRPL
jgi:16S rRNA (guanine527-N7)-methyltransferase